MKIRHCQRQKSPLGKSLACQTFSPLSGDILQSIFKFIIIIELPINKNA